MNAVTFDVAGPLGTEWTLLRLLALIAKFIDGLDWQFERIEFSPSPAAERAGLFFHNECHGLDLLAAVALDPQLIEGSIIGSTADGTEEVRLVAVDGQHWDVYARSEKVIDTIRRSISGVRNLPT